MKLRSISLTNVRRFAGTTACLDGLSDGLNLVCAPNEAGKSTLFEALQALLFVPARSGGAEARGLRPYAGGAPEVRAELDLDGASYRIAKRWLSRPFARVTELPSGRIPPRTTRPKAGSPTGWPKMARPSCWGSARACWRWSPRGAIRPKRTSRRVGGDLLDRGEDRLQRRDGSRGWVRQAERDQGLREGMTSVTRERLKALEREVRELRQANEILRKASAYFAMAELDRRSKP